MNMMNTETRVTVRERVEDSLAKTLVHHGFSHVQAQAFVPLAYDHFHTVNNAVPADVKAFQDFLLKNKEGKTLVKNALALFAAQAKAARAIPVDVDEEASETPQPLHQDWTTAVTRMQERAREAYEAYIGSGSDRHTRNPRPIVAVLAEMVAMCKAHDRRELPLPWQDYTPMATAFFHPFREGVLAGHFPKEMRLDFVPGGKPLPKGQPKGKMGH